MVPGIKFVEVKGRVKDALFGLGFPCDQVLLFLWGRSLQIFGEIQGLHFVIFHCLFLEYLPFRV